MEKIKTADKASISNTEVKSTEIGLKETESNRVAVTVTVDTAVASVLATVALEKNYYKKTTTTKFFLLHDNNIKFNALK